MRVEPFRPKIFQASTLLVLSVNLVIYPISVSAQNTRARSASTHKPAARSSARRPAAATSGASSAQITVYLNRLRAKLIQAWLIPDGNNHVTITGNFNQDGLSDNLKGSSNPKNDIAELAAMEAFNKCMPLEAPPAGLNGGKVTVDFLSNADPHGSSKSSVNLRLDPVAAPNAQAAQPAQPSSQPSAQASPAAAPAAAQPAIAEPAVNQ